MLVIILIMVAVNVFLICRIISINKMLNSCDCKTNATLIDVIGQNNIFLMNRHLHCNQIFCGIYEGYIDSVRFRYRSRIVRACPEDVPKNIVVRYNRKDKNKLYDERNILYTKVYYKIMGIVNLIGVLLLVLTSIMGNYFEMINEKMSQY